MFDKAIITVSVTTYIYIPSCRQNAAKQTSCCKSPTSCVSAPWLEPMDVWRTHHDIQRSISRHTDQDQEQLHSSVVRPL